MAFVNSKAFLINLKILIVVVCLFLCVTVEADWLDDAIKWKAKDDSKLEELLSWATSRCDTTKTTKKDRWLCYLCCMQLVYPGSTNHGTHSVDCFNGWDILAGLNFWTMYAQRKG